MSQAFDNNSESRSASRLKETQPALNPVATRNLLIGSSFAIFIIWAIGSLKSIWLPNNEIIVLPLSEGLIGIATEMFGGYRPILPGAMTELSLFALCLLGPLSLVFLLFLLSSFVPGARSFKLAVALFVTTILYRFGAPGEDPHTLLELCYVLLLLTSFLKLRPKPLILGIVGGLGIVVSLVTQAHSFTLYWLVASAALGSCIHFLFVDKWHIPESSRKVSRKTLLKTLGLVFLFWAILFSSFSVPDFIDRFSPAYNIWSILAGLSMVLFLTYAEPWKSMLWIRIGTALLGGLISYEFLLPTYLLLFWLVMRCGEILFERSKARSYTNQLPAFFWKSSYYSFVVLMFLVMFVQIIRYQPQRALFSGWTYALTQAQSLPDGEGLLIYGNAIELFSLFHDAPVFQNAPILLESSEEALDAWLDSRGVQHILVDRLAVRKKWQEFINRGVDPTRINNSVISRLLLYQGESLETKTLDIRPVQLFEASELEVNRIVWISRRGANN